MSRVTIMCLVLFYGLAICAVVRSSTTIEITTDSPIDLNSSNSTNDSLSTIQSSLTGLTGGPVYDWTGTTVTQNDNATSNLQQHNVTREDEETRSEVENIFNASSNDALDEGGGNVKALQDENTSAIGPNESAAILSCVFVVIAAVGYLGFVTWRRRRYGNNEMLITDDVYDITDLRNFEI